ncbi:MAG: MGMT family protein [Thermoplasmata archaeon]|nr:MGMT family protein [Thermoplasmata archaeon]MCI4340761.1 MGMT family protein [Thermoplasmata archaeon]
MTIRRSDATSGARASGRDTPRSGRPRSTLAQLRQVIAAIPRGKVITYGQAATAGGFPGAARLTVWALRGGKGLPWHRVVGAGGRIALQGEDGEEQRLRLTLEGVRFRGARVQMDVYNWTPKSHAGRGVRGILRPSGSRGSTRVSRSSGRNSGAPANRGRRSEPQR